MLFIEIYFCNEFQLQNEFIEGDVTTDTTSFLVVSLYRLYRTNILSTTTVYYLSDVEVIIYRHSVLLSSVYSVVIVVRSTVFRVIGTLDCSEMSERKQFTTNV